MFAKTIRCSFCKKTDKMVNRMLGGPGVHICDECVGVCNTVLEATPAEFSGWQNLDTEVLLAGLAVTQNTIDATANVLHQQVGELRNRKTSWELIGGALGVSRQAAWERFS